VKYFTTQWWSDGCKNADTVFQQYERYLASVRHRLPAALCELEDNHTLHDSRVKQIVSDFPSRCVKIVLHGWDRTLSHQVCYTLSFSGVSIFEQDIPTGRNNWAELGDLGYWECEVLSQGIEIRMLFASSAEFRIAFEGFEFLHAKMSA